MNINMYVINAILVLMVVRQIREHPLDLRSLAAPVLAVGCAAVLLAAGAVPDRPRTGRAHMALLRPGLSFRDHARAAWKIPDRFAANRYYLSAHGCGMTGEYPYLYHEADFDAFGYDGALTENMTICIESYIGEPAGGQGVKLEQQVLLTADGPELLSTFPLEEALTS